MYGTNAPRGFIPVRHENGSAWNNQLNSDYTIPSGYNYNIGQGELVYISAAGNIVTAAQLNIAGQIVSLLGVFWGCNYVNPSSFPISGPLGHVSWVAGTVTGDGNPAQALIIKDPSVVYTAQSNGSTGFIQATASMQWYGFDIGTGSSGVLATPPGGTLNADGTSCMLINLSSGALVADTAPIRTLCLDPNPNNPIGPFNNALCMIQNGYTFAGGKTHA